MFLFLSAGIGEKLTGIEHAILKRKELFDNCGIENKIITLNFSRNYKDILDIYELNQKDFLNLYESYQKNCFLKFHENSLESFIKKIEGEVYLEYIENQNNIKVFVDDVYRFYINLYDNGQINYVNFFDLYRNKVKREMFNKNGYLSQIIILNNNQRKIIKYFDYLGGVKIEEYYGDNERLNLIILKSNDKEFYFNTKDKFIKHWIIELMESYNKVFVYSDKNKLYNNILIDIKFDHVKIFSVLHSVHFRNPKEIENGSLNGNYKICLNNIEKFDGFIVSTQAQKNDILKRFGEDLKIWVIPPAFFKKKQKKIIKSKEIFKIISVGRYYEEKRLDHVISAIDIVYKKYSNIQLDLYGFGDSRNNYMYEKKIKEQVTALGLQEVIKFKGYVQNIHTKLAEANISVVTSTIEGFCIGILDSLSVGTPVVAYNIKYGPAEMIKHGLSGYLVEDGNIDQLAYFIEKAIFNKEISNFSFNDIEIFSETEVKNKWLKHIREVSYV